MENFFLNISTILCPLLDSVNQAAASEGGGTPRMSQGARAKCTSPKKAWAWREGLFGNFSCHFRVTFWEGGNAGEGPSLFREAHGG